MRSNYILWPHPPAGFLFNVVSREDDEFCADLGRPGTTARRKALAGRRRLGGIAPRWRFGGLLCDVRYRHPGNHLLPSALRCRGGGGADSRKRPAALAGRSVAGGKVSDGQAFGGIRRSPSPHFSRCLIECCGGLTSTVSQPT